MRTHGTRSGHGVECGDIHCVFGDIVGNILLVRVRFREVPVPELITADVTAGPRRSCHLS